MCHNNVTFSDEKSFTLNDLLKLRVRKDPLTGEIPTVIHGSGVNVRKRHNMFCTIRPFNNSNSSKTLICVITEQNGTAELFQRYVRMIIGAGFLVVGDIAACDNASIHVNAENADLQSILSSVGIDVVLLPSYSPELNPIELVFNVMAARFKSRHHESMFNTDYDVLAFLHEVINSITPDITFSCYQKCGCVNYF